MSEWRSNWQQPPLPCEHNTTGLCVDCVMKLVNGSALVADMELKRVADSAIDVMRKLRWERDEATKRATEWEHEAKANAGKLASESRLKSRIAELEYCNERLVEQAARERAAFTKRRKDKVDQWNELAADRDSQRQRAEAAERRAAELEAHFLSCEECHECAFESGLRFLVEAAPKTKPRGIDWDAVCAVEFIGPHGSIWGCTREQRHGGRHEFDNGVHPLVFADDDAPEDT